MREFKYVVGVIATVFLLNLLLVKLSEESSTKTDFRGKNQKDMSHDGISKVGLILNHDSLFHVFTIIRQLIHKSNEIQLETLRGFGYAI